MVYYIICFETINLLILYRIYGDVELLITYFVLFQFIALCYRLNSLKFIRLLRVVFSSQQRRYTEGVITTRSNRMKFRLSINTIFHKLKWILYQYTLISLNKYSSYSSCQRFLNRFPIRAHWFATKNLYINAC